MNRKDLRTKDEKLADELIELIINNTITENLCNGCAENVELSPENPFELRKKVIELIFK